MTNDAALGGTADARISGAHYAGIQGPGCDSARQLGEGTEGCGIGHPRVIITPVL